MKNLKILLLLITFSSISNADIIRNVLLDTNEDICIYDNFYIYDEEYHAQTIGGDLYQGGTADIPMILSGYKYDTDTQICSREDYKILGLEENDFNFLMALSGLLFSFVIFFILALFLVGL